jgi:hypothetical protein
VFFLTAESALPNGEEKSQGPDIYREQLSFIQKIGFFSNATQMGQRFCNERNDF